jgi:hypothetical protein
MSVQDKKLSIRDLIAGANDIEVRQEEVPEWGVTLELRAFSLDARSGFIDAMGVGQHENDEQVKGAMKRMYPAMLIAACHDPETGAPVFTEEDVPMLLGKNGKVVDRLGDVIMKMNGMTEDAVEEAKKDSSTTPSSSTS